MKDYWWKIKVSDLINNPWRKDFIEFENKYLSTIPWYENIWFSGKVELQSLSETSIIATIIELKTTYSHACDKCWNNFDIDFETSNYETKFEMNKSDIAEWEYIEEDNIISEKDESIDVENIIFQAFFIQQPLVYICQECEPKYEHSEEVIDDLEEPIDDGFWTKIDLKFIDK